MRQVQGDGIASKNRFLESGHTELFFKLGAYHKIVNTAYFCLALLAKSNLANALLVMASNLKSVGESHYHWPSPKWNTHLETFYLFEVVKLVEENCEEITLVIPFELLWIHDYRSVIPRYLGITDPPANWKTNRGKRAQFILLVCRYTSSFTCANLTNLCQAIKD